MRAVMASAEVGDESKMRDPTVIELCEKVAALLGQEQAIFLPGGTMCNNIAATVHCRRGSEIITAVDSHIETSESGACAVFAGARLKTIDTPNGRFSVDDVKRAVRFEKSTKAPGVGMISVEQTHNRSGGNVWSRSQLSELAAFAKDGQIPLHMDGARLMNATVAQACAASEFGKHASSVWLSFSKGLGCPMGAVLAGSAEFIKSAWEWKYRFGGGMRQAGILAAACLYSLENNIAGLAVDHANAQKMAMGIRAIDGLRLTQKEFPTNIVLFELENSTLDTKQIRQRLEKQGIRLGIESDRRFRIVTHRDVSESDIEQCLSALTEVLGEPEQSGRRVAT